MSKYQKKNLLIGGLLAIVVLMGIAYAAFASNLTITGTGSVSSNWCIGFDSTRASDYEATAGISGGTVPTGSMSFSGDSCSTSFKTTASLNASFKQPGDKIEYTLTIGNKGTLAAAIESINVDGDSVTSDTTITKGNIKYIIEMPESTSLAVNTTTTMKVTAMFQNDTEVTSSTNEQQTISISINAVQDDGSGGMDITSASDKFTGTIYRWDTAIVQNGDSIADTEVSRWCGIGTLNGNPYNSCIDDDYADETEDDCLANLGDFSDDRNELIITSCQNITTFYYPSDEYSSMQEAFYAGYMYLSEQRCLDDGNNNCDSGIIKEGGIEGYVTDVSTLNKTHYLKHDVVDDIITNSYVCFVYNNTEHCLKGGDNGASFAANTQIIKDYQAFYNLPKNGDYPGCDFGSDTSYCSRDGISEVIVRFNGDVNVMDSSAWYCSIDSIGRTSCGSSAQN